MHEEVQRTDMPPAARRRHAALYVALISLVAVGVIFSGLQWRKHAINEPIKAALNAETGAETVVYRRHLLGGNEIVFDVRSVSGEISMTDMTRRLLKSAEALKEADFQKVYLAYQGREKFYFEGAYFKKIGEERSWQNPIYTIRTMPENIRNLDGTPAFETWTGGWLGVMGEQMNDNNEFHRKWWVDDALADLTK